jgi:hypothetical protein
LIVKDVLVTDAVVVVIGIGILVVPGSVMRSVVMPLVLAMVLLLLMVIIGIVIVLIVFLLVLFVLADVNVRTIVLNYEKLNFVCLWLTMLS